jgi:hypothetical protein
VIHEGDSSLANSNNRYAYRPTRLEIIAEEVDACVALELFGELQIEAWKATRPSPLSATSTDSFIINPKSANLELLSSSSYEPRLLTI